MALDSSGLASALKTLFESMPASPDDCADGMTNAYYDYASVAMFGTSVPSTLAAMKPAMKSTLLGAISNPLTGSPSTLASAWSSAVGAFWTGVTVTGTQSGTTNGCSGASLLTSPLTTLFANTANTAETTANGLASNLHTATLTVTATVSPPAATVLPIT